MRLCVRSQTKAWRSVFLRTCHLSFTAWVDPEPQTRNSQPVIHALVRETEDEVNLRCDSILVQERMPFLPDAAVGRLERCVQAILPLVPHSHRQDLS